jgi:hypothetical protein
MKQLITIILLLIVSISCKEKSENKSAADIQETVVLKTSNTVTKTASHIKIPNSHLYIIPPAGFTVNEPSGTVAKKGGYAHLLMMKIISGYTPAVFFSELKAEAEKSTNGTWQVENLLVDEHKATIYLSRIGGIYQRYLVFNDGHTNEMLVANYEESEAAEGIGMYEAMKTVVVKK